MSQVPLPQLEQNAPPLPHELAEVPGLHAWVARSKHPAHFEHTPAEQISLLLQAVQATPLAPHWAAEVAVTQVPLSQQPWQLVQLAPLPPPVEVEPPPVEVEPPPVEVEPPPVEVEPPPVEVAPPAPRGEHWPMRHSSPSEHFWQVDPEVPHADVMLPVWQTAPSQQPWQVAAEQPGFTVPQEMARRPPKTAAVTNAAKGRIRSAIHQGEGVSHFS